MRYLLLWTFGIWFGIQSLLDAQTVQEDTANTLCSCDLRPNYCDVACCCDADCNNNETALFITCDNRNEPLVNQYVCIQKSQVVFNSSMSTTFISPDQLFCIVTENAENEYKYTIPMAAENVTAFLEYKNKYAAPVNATTNSLFTPQLIQLNDTYMLDSPLLVLTTNNKQISTFQLPASVINDMCDGTTSIKMLRDTDLECVVSITPDSCTTNPWLSLLHYDNRYIAVFKNPMYIMQDEQGNLFADADIQLNEQILAGILITTKNIRAPIWNAITESCDHVLTNARFVFHVNATGSVSAIEMDNIQVESLAVGLQYIRVQTIFTWNAQPTVTTDSDPITRSGNPGYHFGRPVMAGNLVRHNETDQLAIQLPIDPTAWLTVPSAARECSVTGDRQSVLFGHDIITGCMIKIPSDMKNAQCRNLQTVALAQLKADRDRVGAFANASVMQPAEWVKVLTDTAVGIVDAPNANDNGCPLHTSVSIEIVFAKVGNIFNAQHKIIGVMYKYSPVKLLKYQCLGQSCASDMDYPILVSVTFIEASSSNYEAVAVLPTLDLRLPYDFFYPFTGDARLKKPWNSVILILLALLITRVHL